MDDETYHRRFMFWGCAAAVSAFGIGWLVQSLWLAL